jgi:hypothetical protein
MKRKVADILKTISCTSAKEKLENSNFLMDEPIRHLQSHNINATSPAKAQHLTHIFRADQQERLSVKMKRT